VELAELAASIPGPKVRLRIVEGEGDAFVYRIFSPVVVLPVSVASLPQEQLRMVLEHELAHVRRRDPLWAWVFEAFRAIYWFHPLAWVLLKRSHLAREMAADDLVLLDGRDAEAYAACLGAAALRHQTQAPPPLPALAFVRQHPVLARLHAILDARRRRTAPSTGGWLAVGLPLALPALVIASLGFKAAAEAQPAQQRRLPNVTARVHPTPSLWSDLIEPMVSTAPAEPQPSITEAAPSAALAASRSPASMPPVFRFRCRRVV
jgi:beta-lactamase regulating signal transducer with metallopeptidase domain